MLRIVLVALSLAVIAACDRSEAPRDSAVAASHISAERDAFTYANYQEARVAHADLDLEISFEDQTLDGVATLDIARVKTGADRIVLDTYGLEILSVETGGQDGTWAPAEYELGEADSVFGAPLEIMLPESAGKARIAYRTSPEAGGLQWLDPAQTADETGPYMYSQNQTIHARSMAPLQDTPAVRMTYRARIRTPENLRAVMSAAQDEGPRDGDYAFDMPQPIPSYLIAIAAGDIVFEPISENIGVYAEPSVVSAGAREFEDTPAMMAAAEALYGPYRWGRFDMLVLPPSFPFGGMENPRLTFLTPTLIAGDKSLTNVVAHELAHSWSGNLVTNATWRDAWLNEGFTSYVENRLIEAVFGRDRAVMEQQLALGDLERAIAEAERPELTRLKMPEDMAHPDEAFSQVSYVKGQFFLTFLEERFGRAAFDEFLRAYFDRFAFRSITTEDFTAYLKANLMEVRPGKVSQDEIDAWLYQAGVPSTAPQPRSAAFEQVERRMRAWLEGRRAAGEIDTANWSAHEWLHFLNGLPDDLAPDRLAELDAAFSLTGASNAEIAFAWYMKAISSGYEPAMPALEEFLLEVGRGKFIYRLYSALAEHGRKDWAKDVYARARPGYHPIAQRRIDAILE